eukprot:CAMPEP_0206485648 /NCGR_PEP_ID=MMETSP0324_2-20121206/40624_1 /ASSEMBLY_ACC=CAM_ASM_000836 /TAXON_ID=2866 /ORGANISM="Crypthecodinium cohnii, Strain Seligo" /LENGTH=67 /DNA_ID=CAMNT_0053963885 /DNA_START=250 /DNA_END=449 /DNA_ORIENTATION=+
MKRTPCPEATISGRQAKIPGDGEETDNKKGTPTEEGTEKKKKKKKKKTKSKKQSKRRSKKGTNKIKG